jgi:hypothetical protein
VNLYQLLRTRAGGQVEAVDVLRYQQLELGSALQIDTRRVDSIRLGITVSVPALQLEVPVFLPAFRRG